MKNIVLMGASRAGKSTLTKMLSERFNNIMIIESDIIRLAFRKSICKDTTLPVSKVSEKEEYINFILDYYKYANKYKDNYIKVIDTVDFEPKDYELFENAIVICLGYPSITKEEVVKNWQMFDTEKDWTKNKPKEKLLQYANAEIKNSCYLKKECNKYNVKFVDTSYNRNEVLNELVDYIEKEINDEKNKVLNRK